MHEAGPRSCPGSPLGSRSTGPGPHRSPRAASPGSQRHLWAEGAAPSAQLQRSPRPAGSRRSRPRAARASGPGSGRREPPAFPAPPSHAAAAAKGRAVRGAPRTLSAAGCGLRSARERGAPASPLPFPRAGRAGWAENALGVAGVRPPAGGGTRRLLHVCKGLGTHLWPGCYQL